MFLINWIRKYKLKCLTIWILIKWKKKQKEKYNSDSEQFQCLPSAVSRLFQHRFSWTGTYRFFLVVLKTCLFNQHIESINFQLASLTEIIFDTIESQSGFSATSVQSSYSRTSSYGFVSLLFKTLFNSFKTVHWTLIIELKINRTESRPRAVSVQLRSSFIWTSSNEPFLVLLKTWIPPAWPIYEFLVGVVDSSLLYENRIQIYECVKGDSCVI